MVVRCFQTLSVIVFTSNVVVFGQPDPCTSYSSIVEPLRSTGYVSQTPDYDHLICDNLLTPGWYRFYSNAGWEMPTTCPPLYHCGTHIPLWLHGTHPTATDGIVTREVCGNVPSGGCCGYKSNIRVKQCNTATSMFYVYELQPTRGCSVAYCAVPRTPCSPDKWSPTGFEPGCKPVYPKMTQNPTLSFPIVQPYTFVFNCHVNFNSSRTDVGFDIEWLFDGVPDRNISTSHISGAQRNSSIDQKYLVGHLGQAISCSVRSHFLTTPNRKGPGIVSKDYWMGIKMEPSSLTVGTKEPPKEVKLISTIPMVCDKLNAPSCKLDIYLEPNNHVLKTSTSCTLRMEPKDWNDTNHQAVVKFKVLAERNPLLKDHHLVLAFNWTQTWDAPPIFNNYRIPYLPIFAKDSPTSLCSCIGDPHCLTLDRTPPNSSIADIIHNWSKTWPQGLWENIYKRGEFVMYKSTNRPFEVQIRTWQCGRVMCICAVVAREGNDVIQIDMCHGSYGHTFLKVTIPNKNITSYGTVIHKDSSGNKWVIEYPSGAVVTVVNHGGKYLNAHINAPEDDYGATQGLCGTFDGNYHNDQTARNGTVLKWSGTPNTFVESWRVPVGSSMFDKPPAPDSKFDNDIYFCNCDQNKKLADCSLKNKAVRPAMHGLQVYNPKSQKPGHSGKKRLTGTGNSADADMAISYYFDYGLFGSSSSTVNFPTASGITQANATRICIDALQNSPTIKECMSQTGLSFVSEIGMCIEDIKFTDDVQYVFSATETAIKNCQEYVLKNESFYSATGQPPAFITTDLCPLDCSGHGTCVKGTCHCAHGFVGDSCTIDSQRPPTLYSIIGSDVMHPIADTCDIRKRPCENIYIVGENIRDHNAMKCRLEEKEYRQGYFQPTGRIYQMPLVYESVYNVLCSMPVQSENPGKDIVAYSISLSNDGHVYSNEIPAFIIDTQCLSCSTNGGHCTIKLNTCLIDGKCRNDQERNASDSLLVCNPGRNQNQWTSVSTPSPTATPGPGQGNTRYDLWTISTTGCKCSSNQTRNNCACCDVDACQCPGSDQSQCVQCSHLENCGTLSPLPVSGVDGYTLTVSDCTCNFNTTRGDCACCQNGGCQCPQPNQNQCVRCGIVGQCGAKTWLFGDPSIFGK